jgi:serine/threonine-protein kinase
VDPQERFALVAVVPPGQSSNNDILRVPITPAGPPVALAASDALEYAPAVSPDGRWLAYVSTASGQQEVFVREMDGTGQWQISTGGGVGPRWSPSGRELFYRNDARQMAVAVQTSPQFAPGTAQVLFDGAFNWRTEPGMNYAVDPISGRFLVIRPPAAGSDDGPPAVRVITNWAR